MNENEKGAKTSYVVLIKQRALKAPDTAATSQGPLPGWREVMSVNAVSAEGAIRQIADKGGEGEYVAVPARSWKPTKVTVETERKVRLG